MNFAITSLISSLVLSVIVASCQLTEKNSTLSTNSQMKIKSNLKMKFPESKYMSAWGYGSTRDAAILDGKRRISEEISLNMTSTVTTNGKYTENNGKTQDEYSLKEEIKTN